MAFRLYKIKKLAITGMMMSLLGTATAYADTAGVSTANKVNIRQEPNTSSSIMGQVNKNDGLVIKGQSDDWYQIEYQGQNAWIYGEYVSVLEQVEEERDIVQSEQVAEQVTQTEQPVQVEIQQPSMGEKIVAYGEEFIGLPYRWGSTDLNRGVDCSGFTQSVMKHFGINLNRVSRDQVHNGSYVDKGTLQIGDLVFFDTQGKNNGAISHVGIYTGNGNFIHSSTNYGVITSSLYESYYQRTYVKAVRVIKEG